ncbi:hypothetical protein CSKR_105942 [Clonorchis sinensis]|uniref:Uncharacterized protein n=1 Tax=Clonorchis sinensis TaxID=79923 RepID=A0A3R7CEE0_CLOSI|nr:hypothetical protein CSKR_105942 [Clonorchis sinensis]
MYSEYVRLDTVYLLPRSKLVPSEVVSEWVINHYDCPFVYDSDKRIFFPNCFEASEYADHSNMCRQSPIQMVFASPFANDEGASYKCDSDTRIRYIQQRQNFTFVIDASLSLRSSNDKGKTFLSDAIDAMRVLLYNLAPRKSLVLSGSGHLLPNTEAIVTIISVLPGSHCCTLVSGWRVCFDEVDSKLSSLVKAILRVAQDLTKKQVREPRCVYNTCNSLVDLLKHGILASSLFADDYGTSSVVLFTDGAFSVNNFEVLDRSLTHLRSERVRCCFVLLNAPQFSSSVGPEEGAAFDFVMHLGSCVPQVDLCTFLAQSTDGFVLNASTEVLPFSSDVMSTKWNNFSEVLWTIPVTRTRSDDKLPGDLHWEPVGMLQLQKKVIHVPVSAVIAARLRDGYRLCKVCSVSNRNDNCNEVTEPPAKREPTCSLEFVQIELEMPWKVGISFHVIVYGLWNEFHDKGEHDKSQKLSPLQLHNQHAEPTEKEVICSGLAAQTEESQTSHDWIRNRCQCHVTFFLRANYSLLQQATVRPKKSGQQPNRASLFSRFITYHRQLSVTDKQLEHVLKFFSSCHLAVVPEDFRSARSAAFSLLVDASGKHVVVENDHQHHEGDSKSAQSPTVSEFLQYWRMFIELDLLECYRWMNVHSIYGILEYDSQLPTNLHLPSDSNRYTVSITCRQSLDLLYASLTDWCSFVLLENNTYVRFLCFDPLTDFVSCEPPPIKTDSSTPDAQDLSCGTTQITNSLEVRHCFCIVRLEVRPPEFRVRLGFITGTPVRLQSKVIQQLTQQIKAIHFPQRGRQAIPKSRHKSGALLIPTETTHVPPLQRSWEETSCCHLFHTRLDRLILNRGLLTNTSIVGPNVGLKRKGFLHKRNVTRKTNIPTRKTLMQRRLTTNPLVNAFARPNLEFNLLKHHLHHESQVWVIQPVALAVEGLRTLFSSLINLRLQEGFHLARVGPQPGFVSLLAEAEMQSGDSLSLQSCLVQYLLYPFVDVRLNEAVESSGSFQTSSVSPIRDTIADIIQREVELCKRPIHMNGNVTSIFDMVFDESFGPTSPFKLIQVVAEVWIQPIEGHIVDPPQEVVHWTGARFDQVASRIFEVDEQCLTNYVTLERLFTLVKSPMKSPIQLPVFSLSSSVSVPDLLGCLKSDVQICWAQSDIIKLTSSSPQVTLLHSLISEFDPLVRKHQFENTAGYSDSDPQDDDQLFTSLCCAILRDRSVIEINLSAKESEGYTIHLMHRMGLSSKLEPNAYPKWRCFVALGSLTCQHTDLRFTSEDPNSKAVINVLFVPASAGDCRHPLLELVVKFQLELLNSRRSAGSCFPVFVYACSRPYLSFLIDDRWTYKVPPDSVFEVLDYHNDTAVELIISTDDGSVLCPTIPANPPDAFLGAGCQNPRLTSELSILWRALHCAADYVSKSHLDAFVSTVYRCLVLQLPVAPVDIQSVLSFLQRTTRVRPISLDITSFLYCCCTHFFELILEKHTIRQEVISDYSTLLTEDQYDLREPNKQGLYLSVHKSRNEQPCTHTKCGLIVQLFERFTHQLPGHPGVFIMRNRCRETGPTRISTPAPSGPCFGNSTKPRPSWSAVSDFPTTGETTLNSDESDTSESLSSLNEAQEKVIGCVTKRMSTRFASDFLIENVSKWFSCELRDDEDMTLFVQLRAVLTYGKSSIELYLHDGLPLFCMSRFVASLEKLVLSEHGTRAPSNSVDSADWFEFNAASLQLRLEVTPIIWLPQIPDNLSAQDMVFDDTLTNQTLRPTELAAYERVDKSISTSYFHCTTLSADQVSEVLAHWTKRSELALFNPSQVATLCRFIFRVSWEMKDAVVCALRSLIPVSESAIHVVLRHIEDTQKLITTPLFDYYRNGRTDSHSVATDLSHFTEGKAVSSAIHNVVHGDDSSPPTRLPKITMHPAETVVFHRVRLDFVTYSSEVFDLFLRRFEAQSFPSAKACLEYLNGAYFLRLVNSSSETSAVTTVVEQTLSEGRCGHNVHSTVSEFSDSSEFPSASAENATTFPTHQLTLIRRTTASTAAETTYFQSLHKDQRYFSGNPPEKNDSSQAASQLCLKSCGRNSSSSSFSTSHGYEGGSSDVESISNEECFYQSLCHPLKSEFDGSAVSNSLSVHTIVSSQTNKHLVPYRLPSYWMLFRVSTNSVSVFFHHTDSHYKRDYCDSVNRHNSHHQTQASTGCMLCCTENRLLSPTSCQYCVTFHLIVRSIRGVVRWVNQKMLLEKLRTERICDVLLVPDATSSEPPQTDGSLALQPHKGTNRLLSTKFRDGNLYSKSRHVSAAFHSAGSAILDRERVRTSFEEVAPRTMVAGDALRSSTQVHRVKANRWTSISSASYGSPSFWRPGYFACPVQITDRIRLHPRVFSATSIPQPGLPTEKGKRIVAALRKRLEKPAIYNQPDMFFLIDFASRASPVGSRAQGFFKSTPDSVDLDGDPVFYMQLTVGQFESQSTVPPRLEKSAILKNQSGELASSFLSSHEPESIHSSSGPKRHRILSEKAELDHFLQYTLRGIDKPSRHLCRSVREMLQTRLDALVLEHFSDSLSRNAVNRLSSADLSFLVSRRPQTPKCHCYVALPKFFLSASELPCLSYAPPKLILAFCHYLKQNLSLFLHAIKLDQDTSFGASEILELFLYNRPRAHGVAKPGVATLVFQLLVGSDGCDGSAQTQHLTPHTIMDWTLPSESTPLTSSAKGTPCLPSFDELHSHIKDYSEIAECDLSTILLSDQLVLSIQIWERGDADIENLKYRVKSTVLHALYDLITEFFVLTTPIKSLHHISGSFTSRTPIINEVTTDAESPRRAGTGVLQWLNPYIPSLVLPWLNHGRELESPLVIKASLKLLSISLLPQLLYDFLRPFNNLNTSEDFSSSGRLITTPIQHGPTGLNSGNMKIASLCLGGVTFLIYKQNHQDKTAFELTGWDKLQTACQTAFPGYTTNYLIVGRNFPAWRQLIRRGNRKPSGVTPTEATSTDAVGTDSKMLSPKPQTTLTERLRTDPSQELDVLLRMQPLRVTFNISVPTKYSEDQPYTNECQTDESSASHLIKGTVASTQHSSEVLNLVTPGGSKLPAFCPIDFLHSPSIASVAPCPSSRTSVTSEHSVDRNSQASKRDANAPLIPTTSAPNSTTSDKSQRVTVLAPRQTFCLISIEGKQITLFTYNWSKEESEGLIQRLTILVDWHNSRHKLLSTISMQKLGLFHHIETSFTHPVASLVHSTCPPELSDGQTTGAIDKQQTQQQLATNLNPASSLGGPSFNAGSTSSHSRQYSSRRRHPTTGTDSTIPQSTVAATSISGCSKMPDPKSHGFSRLFQDCSFIPPLDTSGPLDLVYRHGRQALTVMDLDRRRAQKLDLISLPFRAWQERRIRRKAVGCCTDKSGSPIFERQKLSAVSRREVVADSCAEAALDSEPLQKRLKRFSATRLACRHLHTICTPILFCPTLRAQVVRLIQLEQATLRRVAEACYIAQEKSASKPNALTSLASPSGALSAKQLRDLVAPVIDSATVQRIPSATMAPNRTTGTRSSSRMSNQGSPGISRLPQSSASPWLNWSRSVLVDTLEALTQSRSDEDFSPPGTVYRTTGQTHEWVRQTALSFLRNYAYYIENGVGFRPIQTKDKSTGATKNLGPGTYVLLHRVIHLAGVHIMEVFIRRSHLYVRLGTIELGRFSRYASRALISGPLSAEVITQAAASAAITAASVRRNVAASIVPVSGTSSRDLEVSSTSYFPNHCINGFSWDESSRLCDYTHIHSFSYDYYLRVMQEYLATRSSSRQSSIGVVRKLSLVRHTRSTPGDSLGILDYPIADFLADLNFLVPRPPVFARNCLRSIKLSHSVGAFLRPEQVFHHLIEDHSKYDLHIVRMTRTGRDSINQSDKPSFTFGIYEQHLSETSRVVPSHSIPPPRQGSFSLSPSTIHPHSDIAAVGSSRASNTPLSAVSPNYSLTAILVADDKAMEGSPQKESPGQLIHLTLHLFATDPSNRFPKSRLVSAQDVPHVIAKCPIEWPAVAPTPYLKPPKAHALLRTQSTGNDGKLSTVGECSTSTIPSARSRYTSVSVSANSHLPDTEPSKSSTSDTLSSSCDSPHKWHVSYLGMWPAHQVPIQQALELAQTSMEEHVFRLIERSGLDCHKNLLWYRLFDIHHYLNEYPSQYCAPQPAVMLTPTPIKVSPPTLIAPFSQPSNMPRSQMTNAEIEELAQSAPFEMDIFLLDKRLKETIRAGAQYLGHVGWLINRNFLTRHSADALTSQNNVTVSNQKPSAFVWLLQDNDPNTQKTIAPEGPWIKHHMALLCPEFTDGFILLSWAEKGPDVDQTPSSFQQNDTSKYKDFRLRALFRSVGDPMNPGSMRCLIDSGQQIQGLFFERSPLASLVTNFVEILGFCIWRGLHTKPS